MEYILKNFKLLAVVGLLLVAGIVGAILYQNSVFRVVSTTPTSGSKITQSPTTIAIEFSKEVSAIDKERQISANADVVAGAKVTGNTLYLQLQELIVGQSYEIKLSNITSVDGGVMADYTYSFTYDYPANGSSTNQPPPSGADPVLNALPVTTDRYYINYTLYDTKDAKGQNEKITIALLLTNEDLADKPKIKAYKKEALDYLLSKGINADDYIVEYAPAEAASL